jgi:hypothetical protein
MLSAIIPARNSFRDLQVLLTELVAAAVEGLVRQVLVADPEAVDRTPDLCEDAGAVLVRGGLAAAAARARAERLLILPPQIRLNRDWIRTVADHVGRSDAPAMIRGEPERGGARAILQPRSLGLIVDRADVIALREPADLASLRRRLGRRAVRLG